MDNKDYVWYACYGSNLLKERFMLYIKGGKLNIFGIELQNKGCRDKAEPKEEKQIKINHELYFAKNSSRWDNGGIAFLKINSSNDFSYGRAYLITEEQLNEIIAQEGGIYYNKIRIGEMLGFPVYTFTSSVDYKPPTKPSSSYLKVIIMGLKQTYPEMTNEKIINYLINKEGINGNYNREEITKII
jgi:hypothetical protein